MISVLGLLLLGCDKGRSDRSEKVHIDDKVFPDNAWFDYQEVSGIGYERGVSRRDPSDIINVGNRYYVWYTRIPAMTNDEKTPLYNSGYYGTIWYATSTDEGYTWMEQGEALGAGENGAFDSHAVFTPNILYAEGKYHLFYTAVKPTPGNLEDAFENNSDTDFTSIGVAVADVPDGPFIRIGHHPVVKASKDTASFDSYRVDDAALLVREGRYWLYYKGRSLAHGPGGPAKTRMGAAFAEQPEGPYQKHGASILDSSHEVLIWNHKGGVIALASLSSTLEFAPDGLDFKSKEAKKKVENRPSAPGLYRPHLTDSHRKTIPGWGLSMGRKAGDIYLVRFEMKSEGER